VVLANDADRLNYDPTRPAAEVEKGGKVQLPRSGKGLQAKRAALSMGPGFWKTLRQARKGKGT
jgi:hypothetical protein